jgi:hypothetical protein
MPAAMTGVAGAASSQAPQASSKAASKPPCSALRGRFMMPAVDARVASTLPAAS